MALYIKREVLEDLAIIGGLVGMQFVYAANAALLSYVMSLGYSHFTIVFCFSLATSIILSPFAVYFERSQWPKQFTLKLMIQLFFVSIAGVMFQALFLKGIHLTSPTMATTMPNLGPGITFIIACCCRLEKVALNCLYSKVKIGGTFLCVLGATTMSLMQSTVPPTGSTIIVHQTTDIVFDKDKIIGCLFLMGAALVLSGNVVLQAATLGAFPAPTSMCAITSFIGVIITAIVQSVQGHNFEWSWSLIGFKNLIGFSLLGGLVTGAALSFNGWAIKKKGPLLVSMFTPIGTVISIILSFITLGETISLGSLAGMLIMFTGLYFVLWAKGKEVYLKGIGMESEFDAEKPLLS